MGDPRLALLPRRRRIAAAAILAFAGKTSDLQTGSPGALPITTPTGSSADAGGFAGRVFP